MEYIRKNIERKINFFECNNNTEELKVLYQSYLEYLMIYTLGYLWNKNFNQCDIETKTYVIELIQKPTIGDIEVLCRKLDLNKEIFKDKGLSRKFSKYPQFRNEKIGHGYVFSDGTTEFVAELKDFCDTVKNSGSIIYNQEIDLVKVLKRENGSYKGITFKSNGSDYYPWSFPDNSISFEVGSIYGLTSENIYFKLSPFLAIDNENEYYTFSSIVEPLSGKCKYNRLLKSGVTFFENQIFCNQDIETDNLKRITKNGTIISLFKKNYSKYIETTIKDKVLDFLLNAKHSVTATIWGHGGVGKTATVQKICDELGLKTNRRFDYIVFTTAKDRFYNYLTGTIEESNERISSYEELIKAINQIILNDPKFELESIINFQQQLLIIIDDFETFSDEEKEKIASFIRKLDVTKHRVLITTRANIIIGEEIKTNELDIEEATVFLNQVFVNELSDQIAIPNEIKTGSTELKEKIHWITSGRPIFIYQFAFIIAQKGTLKDALLFDIKKSDNAVEFLYGRIYDYLSPLGKDIFASISLLVSENDLSNVIKKLAYILNIENRQEEFGDAINELVKLKILEIKEENFFYIYSKEILTIMTLMYNKRTDSFKGNCNRRLLQISRDKKLDNEQALLQFANSNRYSKNEEEVISSYKQILNRITAPKDIRLQAILNLTSYLVIDRGKRETAIKIFENNFSEFADEGQFIKMISTYYWANGSDDEKEKAIQLLGDFTSKNRNLKIDINLELLGLLLTFKTIQVVSKKERIKDKLNYNEITVTEFSKLNKSIKQDFKNIIQYHGWPLYNFVNSIDFNSISSGSRQNIVTGFYQFSELFTRLSDYDNAAKVCVFALEKFPDNFHKLFRSKLGRVKRYDNKPNAQLKEHKISEFGELLSNVLKEKTNR